MNLSAPRSEILKYIVAISKDICQLRYKGCNLSTKLKMVQFFVFLCCFESLVPKCHRCFI